MTDPDAATTAAFEAWFDPDWLTMIPMDAFAAGYERGRASERQRIRPLVEKMRTEAARHASDQPLTSSALYDYANMLADDLLDGDGNAS